MTNYSALIILLLLALSICAAVFYVAGRLHEREKYVDQRNERFNCCDHCYNPTTGELTEEHFAAVDDWEQILVMNNHRKPCAERGCLNGQTYANSF